MISLESIPDSLKQDRQVAPFIARLAELLEANPVVSYWCKLYVIDHILGQKLHQGDKDVEAFVVLLLDETEEMKESAEDESVRHVLSNKQLSINFVFVFAFKLFNSCLEDLRAYDGVSKPRLAAKLRATINFWSLFSVFSGDNEADPIDYSKTTGGQCSSEADFTAFTKEKIKTLKYQLSRLLKDEVPIKGEEAELDALEFAEPEALVPAEANPKETQDESTGIGEIPASETPELGKHDHVDDSKNGASHDPETVESQAESEQEKDANDDSAGFELPGAPRFDPSTVDASDDSSINLPGAPKFLPDGDVPPVIKSSPIQVIPPAKKENGKSETTSPSKPETKSTTNSSSNVVHVTKETLHTLVDTTEQIGKIQKHAKFAISALNYEDLATAEAELLKGLELLRVVKEKS